MCCIKKNNFEYNSQVILYIETEVFSILEPSPLQ